MLSKVIQHVIIACIALHSNDTANPKHQYLTSYERDKKIYIFLIH